MNNRNPERDKIIVDSLNEGNVSISELGRQFGISRERVAQIYSRVTGFPRGTLRKIKKHNDEMAIKFVCRGCSTPVTVRDGRYLHKYCRDCHQISQTTNRIPKVTSTCTNCGKKYHPLSISARRTTKKIGEFCSFKCYLDYPKRLGRPKGSKNAKKVGI